MLAIELTLLIPRNILIFVSAIEDIIGIPYTDIEHYDRPLNSHKNRCLGRLCKNQAFYLRDISYTAVIC